MVGDGDDLDAAAQQPARDDLTPLALLSMTAMPQQHARVNAMASETRRTERRADELLVAMREFNEIMRESNATMKAILQRLLALSQDQ